MFKIINPADLKPVTVGDLPEILKIYDPRNLPVCDGEIVERLAKSGRQAQALWEDYSFSERLALFKNLKRYIQANYRDFIKVIQAETGKTWCDAMCDVVFAASEIYELEKRGAGYLERKSAIHPFLRNKKAKVIYEPHPLVGVISPWNLPLAIPAADVFPAIFSGSAVILKPSEYAPLTALMLKEAFAKSGFPDDLFQIVLGYGDAGVALCGTVDYVSFTGSCETGKKVAYICKSREIPYNLEMGGKAAAIVLSDANVKRAAYALVFGTFANTGQYCKSFERVYVHRKIYDALVTEIFQILIKLVPGRDYGPMITKFQYDIVEWQLEEAAAGGARIFSAPGVARGQWITPKIVLGASHQMSLVRDETFGPVMPIMPYDDIETAVSFANDSHLGLNASIFTENEKLFYKLAEKIEAGNIVGNDAMINWLIASAPQCGRKQSTSCSAGLSRHGQSGFQRFGRPKTVVWHGHPFLRMPFLKNKELWWMPYNKLTEITLKIFLKAF